METGFSHPNWLFVDNYDFGVETKVDWKWTFQGRFQGSKNIFFEYQ